MKLLHPEVEIEPGRAGNRPTIVPVPENLPLPGSAVVRLTNTTTQENAYTVRLHCDSPFWQESWYTVTAISAPTAPGAAAIGKADQRGPQDRWVKVYVPRGGSRDILIRFEAPKRPESRAGRYEYRVSVETHGTGPSEGGHRADRVVEFPAVAIVRPFYKWGVDVAPEQKRATRLRPSAEYEIVLTNEGNDWLYCDLQLPRSKEMTVDCRSLRLAMPPPEPGELLTRESGQEERPGTQRTIPLRATTKLKTFRGDLALQPLPITALRQDAPSVAPPPGAANYTGTGAVIAANTSETEQTPGDRYLVYAPPVPSKLTDFFTHSATSVRTLIMSVLGIILLAHFVVLFYDNWKYQNMDIRLHDLNVVPGKPVTVDGPMVVGAQFLIGNKDKWYPLAVEKSKIASDEEGIFTQVQHATDRVTLSGVPSDLDGKKAQIKAVLPTGLFFMLSPLLPARTTATFDVGMPVVTLTPSVVGLVSGTHPPGSTLSIGIHNFGGPGTAFLNGNAVDAQWSDNRVAIKVPGDIKPDESGTIKIALTPASSQQQIQAGYFTLPGSPVPPVGSTGGTPPPATSGGGTAGGSTGGGGGNPKPTTGGGASGGSTGGSNNQAQQQARQQAQQQAQQRAQQLAQLHGQQAQQRAAQQAQQRAGQQQQASLKAAMRSDYASAISSANAAPSDLENAIKAYALAQQGNAAGAQPLADSAANSADPMTKSFALTAQAIILENSPAAAKAKFDDAITAKQDNLVPYIAKACYLIKTDDPDKKAARDAANQHAVTNQDKAALYYAEAKTYQQMNRTMLALGLFQKARSLDPSLPPLQ